MASPIEYETATRKQTCSAKQKNVASRMTAVGVGPGVNLVNICSPALVWFGLSWRFSCSLLAFPADDLENSFVFDAEQVEIDKIEKPVESRRTVFAATQNIEKPKRGRGRPKKVWNLYCFAGMRFVLKSLFKKSYDLLICQLVCTCFIRGVLCKVRILCSE